MKVYIDKNEMKLLQVDKERPFYTGYESDHLPSIITVYFNTDVSESSVTLSFLLANGRTPRKNLVFDANGTEIVDGTTWYYYTWNLSTKEGILTSPGQLQMTLSVTTSGVVEQLLFTNNVVRTARFGNNENVVVYSGDPLETILDFAYDSEGITAALAAANVKLDNLEHKINYIGEDFTTKQDMYDAAFEAIYTNDNSIVTARFEDNVYIFVRADSDNEEYLMMVDASTYAPYKLKSDGTVYAVLPRLSILPNVEANVPNNRLVLSVCDTNDDSMHKISIPNLADRIIKTAGTELPSNMQKGQYVFLEIDNE